MDFKLLKVHAIRKHGYKFFFQKTKDRIVSDISLHKNIAKFKFNFYKLKNKINVAMNIHIHSTSSTLIHYFLLPLIDVKFKFVYLCSDVSYILILDC